MRHVLRLSSSQCGRQVAQHVRDTTVTARSNRFISSSFPHKATAPVESIARRHQHPAGASVPSKRHRRQENLSNAVEEARSIIQARAETPPHINPFIRMKSTIQFITTPTADTPGTALLLSFDDKRYLIGNIHEGLQRAALQVGARCFRAKDFLITGRTEWQTTGGLMGMLLSVADGVLASATARAHHLRVKQERRRAREGQEGRVDEPSDKVEIGSSLKDRPEVGELPDEDPTVTLHGGPNLCHTLATARSFIFRQGIPLRIKEHHKEEQVDGRERDWEPTWSDNRIQVWAMPIAPSTSLNGSTSTQTELRQRTLGDFMTGNPLAEAIVADQTSIRPTTPENQSERDQEIREYVVSEMFGSTWRSSDMVETKLHEVILPATVFVRNQETGEVEKYTGPLPKGTDPVPNIDVLVRKAWPGALVDHLPPTKPSQVAMSYIIRNHKQRGKFQPDVARALGIPQGRKWAALAGGEQVQGSNGEIVTPEMVLGEGKEGIGVAVVDLPTHEYVESLVKRSEWASDKVMVGVGAIIWILGPGVVYNEMLSTFINENPQLKHVISSPDQCPNYLAMTSAASAAIKHNLIDPRRFSIPIYNNAPPSQLEEANRGSEDLYDSRLLARRGLKIQLQPSFEIIDSEIVPHLDTAAAVQEMPDEVLKLGEIARSETVSKTSKFRAHLQHLPSDDAEIICLGTGSALPSQHRNVSATLLRVPGFGSYLLDCGENTLGQLKRMYTKEQLSEILHDLKLIWISHMHADHHLGITSVIKAWYEEVHGKDRTKNPRLSLTEVLLAPGKCIGEGKRLFVIGMWKMMRWLQEYSSVEDFGYNQIIPLEARSANKKRPDQCTLDWNGLDVGFTTAKDSWVKTAMRKATGLTNLVAVSVNHCYGSQAVSLSFLTGLKVSYSGDCRPSRDFAFTGKDSTVLIHEATFDDELMADAKAKKHSTASEAIGVGLSMGAKTVILTHFSQRYQKIPPITLIDSSNIKLEGADSTDNGDQSTGEEEARGPEPPLQPTTLTSSDPNAETEETPQQPKPQPDSQSNPPSPPKPRLKAMKVAIAHDYMRIRVRDIMHLEKFDPAMRELSRIYEEERAKPKRALREAFRDDAAESGTLVRKMKFAVEDAIGESGEKTGKKKRKGNENGNGNGNGKGNGKGKREKEKEDVVMGENAAVEVEAEAEADAGSPGDETLRNVAVQ